MWEREIPHRLMHIHTTTLMFKNSSTEDDSIRMTSQQIVNWRCSAMRPSLWRSSHLNDWTIAHGSINNTKMGRQKVNAGLPVCDCTRGVDNESVWYAWHIRLGHQPGCRAFPVHCNCVAHALILLSDKAFQGGVIFDRDADDNEAFVLPLLVHLCEVWEDLSAWTTPTYSSSSFHTKAQALMQHGSECWLSSSHGPTSERQSNETFLEIESIRFFGCFDLINILLITCLITYIFTNYNK